MNSAETGRRRTDPEILARDDDVSPEKRKLRGPSGPTLVKKRTCLAASAGYILIAKPRGHRVGVPDCRDTHTVPVKKPRSRHHASSDRDCNQAKNGDGGEQYSRLPPHIKDLRSLMPNSPGESLRALLDVQNIPHRPDTPMW